MPNVLSTVQQSPEKLVDKIMLGSPGNICSVISKVQVFSRTILKLCGHSSRLCYSSSDEVPRSAGCSTLCSGWHEQPGILVSVWNFLGPFSSLQFSGTVIHFSHSPNHHPGFIRAPNPAEGSWVENQARGRWGQTGNLPHALLYPQLGGHPGPTISLVGGLSDSCYFR